MMLSSTVRAFAPVGQPQFLRPRPSTITSRPPKIRVLFAKKDKSTAAVRQGDFWEASMEDTWRPTVNDVERISWGKPAKKKGTGSRGVPHRLNEEERAMFDRARQKGFLEVAGSGWRSQRREAPLLNTYRSLCDARGQVSIVLNKGNTGVDDLVVDLSPLRNPGMFDEIAKACLEHQNGGQVVAQENDTSESSQNGEEVDGELEEVSTSESPWKNRPIYQLPPYCIAWELPRAEAKALGKKMSELFDTADGNKAPSKKPVGVKAGKSRRHGGYGIG